MSCFGQEGKQNGKLLALQITGVNCASYDGAQFCHWVSHFF